MNWIQPERSNPGFAMMQQQGGENKRRLSLDQVRALEMTFREDTKLEPAKKLQLARDLGLEPRQVAVWFQNRRVRSKNKQLERDFQSLQQDYQVLKESYDNLYDEILKLQSEVHRLSCTTSQEQEGPHESTATVSPCDEANNNHGGESNSTAAADMHENVKKKEAQQQQQSDSQSQEYGQESMSHCSSLNVELQQNSSGPGFWCSTDHWYSLDWGQ